MHSVLLVVKFLIYKIKYFLNFSSFNKLQLTHIDYGHILLFFLFLDI